MTHIKNSCSAIVTRYLGATRTQDDRVKAWMPDLPELKPVVIDYENSMGRHNAHAQAALEFCERYRFAGTLVSGALERGYVFVFRDNSLENLVVMDGE